MEKYDLQIVNIYRYTYSPTLFEKIFFVITINLEVIFIPWVCLVHFWMSIVSRQVKMTQATKWLVKIICKKSCHFKEGEGFISHPN